MRRLHLWLPGAVLLFSLAAGPLWAAEAGEHLEEAPTLLDWLHPYLPNWIPIHFLWAMFTILLLAVIAWLGTRRMLRRPKGLQNLLEMGTEGLASFFEGVMGPAGRGHVPFLGTLFIYIMVMNLLGLIPGFASATANINTTAALAIVVFLATQIHGFRANGVGYLKHFVGEPWVLAPLMIPLHIVGELVRPLSLALRLFGNIFGEDKIVLQLMVLAAGLVLPLVRLPWLPLQLPMVMLGLLTALVQALIFTLLAAVYISLASGEEHEAAHSPASRRLTTDRL